METGKSIICNKYCLLTYVRYIRLTPLAAPSTCGCAYRPKAWWLAQNKFYGLAQAKATPINILRAKLEEALQAQNGMKIPEKILNLEAEGNRRYRELHEFVLKEVQSAKKSASRPPKGTAAALPTASAKSSKPKPVRPVASTSKGKGAVKPVPASNAGATINIYIGGHTVGQAATSQESARPHATRTKQTARKSTGGKAFVPMPDIEHDGFEFFGNHINPRPPKTPGGSGPKKRDRSPGDVGERLPNKRIRPEDDDMDFRYLTGTYDVSAPHILAEWSFVDDSFSLVVAFDSERRLFGEFHLGVLSGVLRSVVDIEPRADGASAKFKWCGREEYGGNEVYTPRPARKGVLRFTRRKRDGRHTVKAVMEDVPAMGKCEFTGEKVHEHTMISDKWDDYNEDAYEEANRARWN